MKVYRKWLVFLITILIKIHTNKKKIVLQTNSFFVAGIDSGGKNYETFIQFSMYAADGLKTFFQNTNHFHLLVSSKYNKKKIYNNDSYYI